MNRLTVEFETCNPAPSGHYNLYYRIKGSSSAFSFGGNFVTSPAVVDIAADPNSSIYEGYIQSNCGGGVFGNQIPFETPITFQPFDYLVVKYIWHNSGVDLDILAGFINTGIASVDCKLDDSSGAANNWLGYAQNLAIPVGSTIDTSYAFWALDNTSTDGIEAVLISFNKLLTDHAGQINSNEITFNLNAVWWASFTPPGDIQVTLQTYLGGTMSKVGTDIVNTGGALVNELSFNKSVGIANHLHNYTNSERVGLVVYNKNDKTATLIPQ